MAVVVVCLVLLVLGLAAGVAWSGRSFTSPAAADEPSAGDVARRYVWFVALALTAGAIAGITVIGAGGRLSMRLLAATAGDGAQGRVTEAEEIVGEITVDGTIGFILFNGLLGGLVAGGIYLLVRRFLPPGRLGGLAFGLALLVVIGTTVDPLRRDNPDFDIVGPGWLAALVFAAVVIAFGITLAAVIARLSDWLPLPSFERRVLVRYLFPAAIAVLAFFITAFLVAIGIVVVLVTRWPAVARAVRSPRAILAGRVLGAVLVVAFVPQAAASLVDIAGR